jgi:hypothetical protein
MAYKGIEHSVAVFTVLLFGGFQANAFVFPTGDVENVTLFNGTGSCPTGYNFYTPPTDGPGTITCYSATVSCPNVADADVWFGVIDPPITPPKGTIVLHYGSGGAQTLNGGFPANFSSKGFETVQVMWHGPNPNNPNWEAAGRSPYYPSIKAAACRPATFFRYIYNTYAAPQGNAECLLGWSAGASAIAYSLKDYSAGRYVDKAVLLAGPPMADLEQGCAVPNYPPIQVWPAGQFGLAYTSSALVSPVFPSQFDLWFDALSGMPQGTCNGANNTTPTQDSTWKNMSIVDGISGEGTLYYPHTALSIWNPGPDSNGGQPSDISAQGEIYARKFKYTTQVAAGCTKDMGYYNYTGPCYSVNEVGGVPRTGDVTNGTSVNGIAMSPYKAIVNDMTDQTVGGVGCIRRH